MFGKSNNNETSKGCLCPFDSMASQTGSISARGSSPLNNFTGVGADGEVSITVFFKVIYAIYHDNIFKQNCSYYFHALL